ncbi:hypothetical protein G9A89_018302 [Geosiphon pyriformis]|nr:hypothetical protein G9A89_018302 [Geosiphon pyriformis]
MSSNSPVRRNIPSFSVVTSSFKSYIASLPLLTSIVSVVCILIYIVDAIQITKLNFFDTLSLSHVAFFNGGVYRIFTFPYPHNSLGHILFCLLAFVPLSATIEHRLGTLEYLYALITVFTLLSGSLYLISNFLFGYKNVVLGGLSTWMFGVVVWESRELAGRERDIFDLIRVPAHFYPLVLLLLMEIFFPRQWFAGHVCGLIAGSLYSFGYLSRLLPSSEFFARLETKSTIHSISKIRGFVKAEEGSRGGWWLPLWNDDVLEDAINPPNLGGSVDESPREPAAGINQIPAASSPPRAGTSNIFTVEPSSNSSSPSIGSPIIEPAISREPSLINLSSTTHPLTTKELLDE